MEYELNRFEKPGAHDTMFADIQFFTCPAWFTFTRIKYIIRKKHTQQSTEYYSD